MCTRGLLHVGQQSAVPGNALAALAARRARRFGGRRTSNCTGIRDRREAGLRERNALTVRAIQSEVCFPNRFLFYAFRGSFVFHFEKKPKR
jgi:hypothetical protein